MPVGAWRHFGQSFDLDATPLECGPCPASGLTAGIAASEPLYLHDDLERLIEGEILPRLMLAHREAAEPKRLLVEHRPTPQQITRFCSALLDPAADDITAHVLGLLDEGLSLDSLLLELLTPAARYLGELWEEDECDFLDVTVAIGRLNAVARELCSRLEDGSSGSIGRNILLVPSPGETHTFCLSIVASFFREAGWDVTTSDASQSMPLARTEWFDVIGMTLSCDVYLPKLSEAVRDLRRASCNKNVRVLVGGPLFSRHPERLLTSGADALAEDARMAPEIAESLLEKRAQAC